MTGLQLASEIIQKHPELVSIEEDVLQHLAESLTGKIEFNPSLCSFETKNLVQGLLVVASSHNWSPDDLNNNLKSQLSEDFREKLVNSHKIYGKEVTSMLNTIKWENANVVDCSWAVSKALESRDLVRIGIPSTSITLHTVNPGETHSHTVSFDCDPHQLQDLHFKVKEALNSYENLKK